MASSSSVSFDILARERAARVFGTVARSVDRTATSIDRANRSSGLAARSFSSLGRVAAAAGKAAAAGLAVGVGATVVGMKRAIDSASDLSETMAKVGQIFGAQALPALEAFADGAAKSIGQSKQAALDAAATFATFGKSAGLSGKDLVGFSTQLTSLTSDLASFHNTSPEDAVIAVGAALRGESEPIRRYGILLDDASLRQEALRQGLIATTKQALTPQQKVLAVQALIYKQTADAQGDFARTSDGLANKQRILRAELANITASLGTKLLPVALRATSAFSDFVTGITTNSGEIDGASNRFAEFGVKVRAAFVNTIIPAAKGFWSFLKDDLWPAVTEFARAVGEGVTGAVNNFRTAFGLAGSDASSTTEKLRGFGAVITQVIIPFLGKLVSETLPALGTVLGFYFRGLANITDALVTMSLVGVRSFSTLTSAALSAVGAILNGAARMADLLGPVLGPKVTKAADAFDDFKTRTLGNLAATEAGLVAVQEALAKIRSKSITIDVAYSAPPSGVVPSGVNTRSTPATSAPGGVVPSGVATTARAAAEAAKKAAAAAARASIPRYEAVGGALGGALAKGIEGSKSKAATAAGNAAKAAVDAAKQKMGSARQQLADYAKSVRDSILDFGGLGNFDADRGVTGSSITSFLARQLAAITKFQENLKALAARGVSKSLIRQITDMGVEQGGRFASALATAPKATIGLANSQNAAIAARAGEVGNFSGRLQYGADVAAATRAMAGTLTRMEAQQERLITLAKRERTATLTVKGDASTAKTVRNSTLALSF